ncbi:S8 family peptidase [Bacillus infantis]|jgi:major intracellular serine protease|uniref:S8 family peptidase n=1 Tax=Bacillus infantis TaxID=324767 RepID=UPI001CD7BF61|nr:S8 family peptidase [Bacillus infantis]MCA1038079.1 S8 family peptidase [Bacillus infantis]
MKECVRVIPYQVIEQSEAVSGIPEGIGLIQAPKIWEETRGEGITIAVLDTGCDISHPDLKNQIIGGRNFTGDDSGNPDIYKDYNGHGTHVAGTIAAEGKEPGISGVAPGAKLLIVKVLDRNGSGQYDWIIEGIRYAIDQKADIISMSLGGPNDMPELHEIIKEAVRSNIAVVCAAGNEGDGKDSTDEFAYPGCYNEVISVGAIDLERNSSQFTNSHNEIDLVAPGEEIQSTFPNGKYATLSGTSMAAPHVSGAMALIKNSASKSFDRKLSEAELFAQLIRRTVPLGNSPKLEGNGLVYLTLLEHLSDIFTPKVLPMVVKS